MDATHKDIRKLCVARRSVEVATIVKQSEKFQWIKSMALIEHLKTSGKDSSDFRTYWKIHMND